MSPTTPDLLSELQDVERRRRLEAVASLLSSVAVGQLFFAAFAFGHAQGPMGLRPLEVLVGMSFVLMVSVGVAGMVRRRRLEARASAVMVLQEGNKRRRVALFDAYLTIDQEVVLYRGVRSAKVEDGHLLLRYVDPQHSGPVLREFEGGDEAIAAIAGALPAPAQA